MAKERLALDLRAHIDTSSKALAADVAAAVIENNTSNCLSNRIHSGRLKLVDGMAVDVDTNLPPRYSFSDELDRRESQAGRSYDNVLLTHPEGTLAVWISPFGGPLNYEEGRMRVGVRTSTDGQQYLVYYGIPVRKPITYKDFSDFASRLSEFSENKVNCSDAENLRSQIIVIPRANYHEQDPWFFLNSQIPELEEAWEAIWSSRVESNNIKVRADAQPIADKVYQKLQVASSKREFIDLGAEAELAMKAKGYRFSGSGCGRMNSEISTLQIINAKVEGGKVVYQNGEKYYYVKNCGDCGCSIENYIPAGYICRKCGGKYEGCG